jgi:WD40 repeat protein
VVALADGKRILSASRDHTIRCWDLEKSMTLWKADLGAEVLCLAVSPDGQRLFAGGRGAFVRAYDVEKGTELGSSEVQRSYISALAPTKDGKRVYTAGDRGLVAVDAATLAPLSEPLMGPTKPLFSVAVADDGEWIVAGDADNGLWMWRKDAPKPWWFNTAAHVGPVHAVVLTPEAPPEKPENGGGG